MIIDLNNRENFGDADFTNDEEKMHDFYILSKKQFLNEYSYVSEEAYDNTVVAVANRKVIYMKDIIKFTEIDADGNGTNIDILMEINGSPLTKEIIEHIKDEIANYKIDNESDWDTDGCLNAAIIYLEEMGYKVKCLVPSFNINF